MYLSIFTWELLIHSFNIHCFSWKLHRCWLDQQTKGTLSVLHLIYCDASSITKPYKAGPACVDTMSRSHQLPFCLQLFLLPPTPQPSLCHGSQNMSQSVLQATHVQHVPACWWDAPLQPCTVHVNTQTLPDVWPYTLTTLLHRCYLERHHWKWDVCIQMHMFMSDG